MLSLANPMSLNLSTSATSLLASSGSMNFELLVTDLNSIHKLDRYLSLSTLAEAASSTGLKELQYSIATEINLLSDESLTNVPEELIATLNANREPLEDALEDIKLPRAGEPPISTANSHRRVDAGPHTFHYLRPSQSLITHFGPLLHSLWNRGPQANELLQHWSFKLDRPGRSKEQHQFTPRRNDTERIANELISQGYYVRYGAIPRHLVPSLPSVRRSRDQLESAVYWLVAQAGANEINRTLERLRCYPADSVDFKVVYRAIPQASDSEQVLQDDELKRLTAQLFGQAISMQDLSAACHMNVDGFHVSQLRLSPHGEGGLRFSGKIAKSNGEQIGEFSRLLGAPPKPGKQWIAYGDGFKIPNKEFQHKGIGRELTQRFMALFYHLGVDILEFGASDTGALRWPRLGFDFADPITRDTMLIRFIEYLQEQGHHASAGELSRIAQIRYAWELVDFCLDDGLHAGEAFLKYHGEKKEKLKYRVRFWLHPEYPGWTKLLKASYPPEWDHLHERTRSFLLSFFQKEHLLPDIILSDEAHVKWLQDRIRQWLAGITLYLEQRKKNQLDKYSKEDIDSLHDELFYTCDILHSMMSEHHQGSELGRIFWQRLKMATRHHLPELIHGARALNADGHSFPIFAENPARIPKAYPESWNVLSLNTLRQLRTQASGLSKPPDTPKQYANFLRRQLNDWSAAAKRYFKHVDQQTIHQLEPTMLFIHYRALFWIADVLNMLKREISSTDEFIPEFLELLELYPRTHERLQALLPRLRKVLGNQRLSLPALKPQR